MKHRRFRPIRELHQRVPPRWWLTAFAAGLIGAFLGFLLAERVVERRVAQRVEEREELGARGVRGDMQAEEKAPAPKPTSPPKPAPPPKPTSEKAPTPKATPAVEVGNDDDGVSTREGKLGIAVMTPVNGSSASGRAEFSVSDGTLRVVARVQGVEAGDHGLAILQTGTCIGPTGKATAAPHYNPFGAIHGTPNTRGVHVGDLGNVSVGGDGQGELEMFLEDGFYGVDQLGGWSIVVGKAVVLTANEDDLYSQPKGNTGAIIACGVIKKIKK